MVVRHRKLITVIFGTAAMSLECVFLNCRKFKVVMCGSLEFPRASDCPGLVVSPYIPRRFHSQNVWKIPAPYLVTKYHSSPGRIGSCRAGLDSGNCLAARNTKRNRNGLGFRIRTRKSHTDTETRDPLCLPCQFRFAFSISWHFLSGSANLGISGSVDLEIWESRHLGTWAPGDPAWIEPKPKRQRVASGRSWWGLSADRRALIS